MMCRDVDLGQLYFRNIGNICYQLFYVICLLFSDGAVVATVIVVIVAVVIVAEASSEFP